MLSLADGLARGLPLPDSRPADDFYHQCVPIEACLLISGSASAYCELDTVTRQAFAAPDVPEHCPLWLQVRRQLSDT